VVSKRYHNPNTSRRVARPATANLTIHISFYGPIRSFGASMIIRKCVDQHLSCSCGARIVRPSSSWNTERCSTSLTSQEVVEKKEYESLFQDGVVSL